MKLTALCLAGSALLVAACGPTPHDSGGGGAKALPPSPTFITGNLEPMIVDWQPEQRGDLEEVMRDGLVVVAYDNQGFRLLKGCKVDGKYDFMGMTRRERVVRLESVDDVKANLPLGGMGLAAQLGGEFEKGATLDIAMVTIGKIRTTWRNVAKKDLIGNCANASHVVRGATVGAFAVDKGDRTRARAVAEIFGAGGSGGMSSKSMVRVVDGVLSDCEQALPDSPKAPGRCAAIIRVELIPINASEDEAHKNNADDRSPELRDVCPPGLVMVDGKCTKPNSGTVARKSVAECTYGNARECLEACKVNNAKSCSKLALMAWKGEGGSPQAQSEAAGVAGKACRDGDPAGCTLLGNFLLLGGQGVQKDSRKAAEAFAKGCDDGDADGCMMVGTILLTGRDGVPRNTQLASKALTKGCKGGAHGACSDLGLLFLGGQGFNKDLPLAAGLFKKACDGDNSTGCSNYAYMQEFGMGTPRDVQRAVLGYAKSCKLDESSCTWLAAMFQLGKGGLQKDDNKAVQLYKLSCSKGDPIACAIVRAYLDPSTKVDAEQIKGYVNVWKGTCDAGTARDCSGLGVIAVNLGMREESKILLAKGCQLGDEWGCLMARMQPRIP